MQRPNKVYIVAGGPSLRGYSFESLSDKQTIAVNAAVMDVPNPEYFITVDYTFIRKIPGVQDVLRNTTATKVFVANMQHPFMREFRGAIVDSRFHLLYDLSLFDVVIKSHRVEGIGKTFGTFSSGLNSGYCALQLAVLLRAQKIFLLGVDLKIQDDTHYHDRYCTKREPFAKALSQYAKFWISGLKQIQRETDIEVISCSPISDLNDIIAYTPYEKVLR